MISINFRSSSVVPVYDYIERGSAVIEGVEAYDILCPVSSVTGCRENPLALLKTLVNDPVKSRALDSILVELPVLASLGKLDNDSMFEQLQSVFDSGSFYQDDKFAERLMAISSDLLKTQGIEQPIDKVEKPDASIELSPDNSN